MQHQWTGPMYRYCTDLFCVTCVLKTIAAAEATAASAVATAAVGRGDYDQAQPDATTDAHLYC